MSAVAGFLKRLWPSRLMGQTLLLLLLALLAAQIVSALVLRGETRSFYRGAEIRFLAERMAPIVTLMRETPPDVHERVADALTSRRVQLWVTPAPALAALGDPQDHPHAFDLAEAIARELGETPSPAIRVWYRDRHTLFGVGHHGPMHGPRTMAGMRGAPRDPANAQIIMSVAAADGRWVNAAVEARPPRRLLGPESWFAFLLAALAISVIVVVALRRITGPLARVSAAAVRLGHGERVEPLAEEGPADIRETIRAFNDMQARIQRFVKDRTRMLAAISHDLRTPITSLRLRAEMIDDDETRERMIATLDQMQKMTEASLAFAREEASEEATRPTDIAALIEAIADDLGDLGMDVSVEAEARAVYPCRPVALGRALRNLIENAVFYGERARVRIADGADGLTVGIDDDGPGIPEQHLAHVFEPFVRLDKSRSAETGGIGLGMAIAHDIVRRHGGDIRLENRTGGGLRVTVLLPPAAGAVSGG